MKKIAAFLTIIVLGFAVHFSLSPSQIGAAQHRLKKQTTVPTGIMETTATPTTGIMGTTATMEMARTNPKGPDTTNRP
jgi:hypothetical protein